MKNISLASCRHIEVLCSRICFVPFQELAVNKAIPKTVLVPPDIIDTDEHIHSKRKLAF